MIVSQGSSQFVEAAGLRTHYVEGGSGSPVVCLHGGGPGASGWSNFSRNFETLCSQHRVFLLDQPGFGKTDIPHNGVSGVEHLRAFLDALGIDCVSLIGNSMGAGVSLRFAFEYPERIDKLILMGPGAVGPTFSSTQPSVGNTAIRNFYLGDGPTREKLVELLRLIVYRPEEFLDEALIEERFTSASNPEIVAWRRGLMMGGFAGQLSPNVETMEKCTRVTAPTLILWGTEDRFNPVEVGFQLVKLIPGAQLHVFSDCGHWVQVEHWKEFNRLALSFLSADWSARHRGEEEIPARYAF